MPTYMFLLHNDPAWYEKLSPEDMQKTAAKYMAWSERPFVKDANRLAVEPGRVVRANGGEPRTTEEPYSKNKNDEVLGGYYMVEAKSYEEVVELANDHPHLENGGSIEIRRISGT